MAVPTPDKMKPLQANTNELSLPIMFFPEASKLLLVNALETMVMESIGETFSTRIVNNYVDRQFSEMKEFVKKKKEEE